MRAAACHQAYASPISEKSKQYAVRDDGASTKDPVTAAQQALGSWSVDAVFQASVAVMQLLGQTSGPVQDESVRQQHVDQAQYVVLSGG